MAEERRSLLTRLFGKALPSTALVRTNGQHPTHERAMGTKASLLPQGAYQPGVYEFFSPDGGHTIIPINQLGGTTLAFVAYWYVATRWRAQKIAEAPLMVIEEDQEDASEEWLPEHELAEVLDNPSPDYDMGELLERTSRYLDDGAEALWTIDSDGVGRVARLTPFRKGEFEVTPDRTRLYANFKVHTAAGPKEFRPEQVIYLRDSHSGGWNRETVSRLDVAMSWLRLGESSRQTIRDLLTNAVWPSIGIFPDKDWNPDPETYEKYKQDVEAYAAPGNKGKAFIGLGGGSMEILAAKIRDLVPEEVLNRVESVIAAVSGVPAIVLQFQVGMENSPWSQMEQARKMAYDDCIQPAWRKLERALTRQLLRPLDEDTSHFIRFDRSNIASLQMDRQAAAVTASLMGRAASLNERRSVMGLEPVTNDKRADEIPELAQPFGAPFAAPGGGTLPPGGGADDEEEDPDDEEEDPDDEEEDETEDAKRRRIYLARKARVGSMAAALQEESTANWLLTSQRQLQVDAEEIASLVSAYLPEGTTQKSVEIKARSKQRVMTAVVGYLRGTSEPRWGKATTPLLIQAAERSTAVVAADLNINFNLLHPGVVRFASRESGLLVDSISKTTRDLVSDILSRGIEAGDSTAEIARNVGNAAGFGKDRALVIARTESTRAFNGAPTESLKIFSEATGRRFVKTWSTALDDRVRDEHLALEGETVDIDQPFSNGLQYPSEPNCRCSALHSEVET